MDRQLVSLYSETRFNDARRKALLSALLGHIRRQPTSMLSLEEVRSRLRVRGQRWLGFQSIPLHGIIGSEGRYDDFDRAFLPRSDTLKHRWANIDHAIEHAIELPPVELYKLSDVYFVRDGNHRVSVARQRRQLYVDAYVTELIVDVPLEPGLSMRDLLLKEEYSDFLEWTDLHSLRRDERIEFSELGRYLDLVQHINVHRYYLGQAHQREIGRAEAVSSWYDNVYMPIVEAIRAERALRHFRGRTEADLYCWIMQHRWYMREDIGTDPGPECATRSYVTQFSRKRFPDSLVSAVGQVMVKLFGPHVLTGPYLT